MLLRLALLWRVIWLGLLARLWGLWLWWCLRLRLWLWRLLLLLLGLLLGASQSMTLQSDLGRTSGTSNKVTMHVLIHRDVWRLWSNRKLALKRSTLILLCVSTRLGRLSSLGCFLSLCLRIRTNHLNSYGDEGNTNLLVAYGIKVLGDIRAQVP